MPKVNIRVGRRGSNFPHDDKTFSPFSGKLKTYILKSKAIYFP